MSYSALYSCCTGARSMTFTTCGVIVGSRILVVTQRACHTVESCVNCENTTRGLLNKAALWPMAFGLAAL